MGLYDRAITQHIKQEGRYYKMTMIRLAEKKDFHQLAEMRWQHSAEDDITYGTTNVVGVDKRTFIDEYVSFLNNDPSYKIFVMEQEEVIISAMYVTFLRKIPKPKVNESYIAYLTNVHTLREYRNRGNGTALLSYIKNYLRNKGCELMIVWPSDNSINWYLRNGFNSENDVLECEL